MEFSIKGLNGKCEFKQLDMRDGLRLAGYAAKLDSGNVDECADAMEKIGLIAIKYLKVDDTDIKDIAGLEMMSDGSNPMMLVQITTKFMEDFQGFL